MKQNNSTEFSGLSSNNIYNKSEPPNPLDPKSLIFPGFPAFSAGIRPFCGQPAYQPAASQASRIRSLELSILVNKCCTFRPLFIAEILLKMQDNPKVFLRILSYIYTHFGNPKLWEDWKDQGEKMQVVFWMCPKQLVLTIVLKTNANTMVEYW